MAGLSDLIRSTGIIPASDQQFFMDDKVHRFRIHGEKMSKASGSYQLCKKDDGRVIGWVRDHRQAITVPISTKGKTMSDEDKRRVAAEKKAKQDAKEAVYAEVAQKAQDKWRGGRGDVTHPYAMRKGISVIGARVLKDLLLIPMYDDDAIVNVQCIDKDGNKRFLRGGKKIGCYGMIAPVRGQGINKIYVVEGWATGVTVHLATGGAVAIAFDCGNLASVIKRLREKHPASRIINPADDDQWTMVNGKPFNAGRIYGASCGADEVIFPPFPKDHPQRLTDWNDYQQEHGIEEVRRLLLG